MLELLIQASIRQHICNSSRHNTWNCPEFPKNDIHEMINIMVFSRANMPPLAESLFILCCLTTSRQLIIATAIRNPDLTSQAIIVCPMAKAVDIFRQGPVPEFELECLESEGHIELHEKDNFTSH